MKPDDHTLIQNVLDGSVDPVRFATFQQRLRTEPDLVALYHDYALLHHSLAEEFEGRRMIDRPTPMPRPSPRPSPRSSAGPLLAIAAAVAFVAAGVWWLVGGNSTDPPAAAARATFSQDASWSIAGESSPAGNQADIPPGTRIELNSGGARIDLAGGAFALLAAPAALVYQTPGLLQLEHGCGRFHNPSDSTNLTVKSPSLTAVDLGTEFGVIARPGGSDELHVFAGKVELQRPGTGTGRRLSANQAAMVAGQGDVISIAARPEDFPTGLPTTRRLLAENFETATGDLDGREPAEGQGHWSLETGTPVIRGGALEGTDFTAFLPLPAIHGKPSSAILLVTLETSAPGDGRFHTSGWAGLSLFQGSKEIVFFGDSFGRERSWSLDIKQDKPPVVPTVPIPGPRTVTLRYDSLSGDTSLHIGPDAGRNAFVRATLPVGLTFDRLRVGASQYATIAIRSIQVCSGGL